jgi:SAM-dependent methyltransferase
MEETIEEFLKLIPADSAILDLGCGSGRDSLYFLEEGFDVTAIDGSRQMCELAEIEIGQDVVHHMMFDELEFEDVFDGIWACASLLHVEKDKLKSILVKIRESLKIGAAFYASFKDGHEEEIVSGKYYNYLTYDDFLGIIDEIGGLELVEYYNSMTVLNNNESRSWNNFVLIRR